MIRPGVTSIPFTYLGILIGANPRRLKTWKPIIENLRKWLSKWKHRQLSFVGRLTLTKSVLATLASYTMQTIFLPRLLCKDLNKKSRGFIWGDIDDQRNIHMVAWENIFKPKCEEGLGIHSSRHANKTFMVKSC